MHAHKGDLQVSKVSKQYVTDFKIQKAKLQTG